MGGLIISCVACGGEAPSERADGLAVARCTPVGTGGFSAALAGVVEAQDGCLVVRSSQVSEPPWVPIFARNDKSPGTVAIGDEVTLGGGEVGRSESWEVPAACGTDGPFWLVSQP